MNEQKEMSQDAVMEALLEVLAGSRFDAVKISLDAFKENFVFAFTQRGEMVPVVNTDGIIPAMKVLGLNNVSVRRHTVPRRRPFSRAPFSDIRVYVPLKDNPLLIQ